jgi:hypothetical protein
MSPTSKDIISWESDTSLDKDDELDDDELDFSSSSICSASGSAFAHIVCILPRYWL